MRRGLLLLLLASTLQAQQQDIVPAPATVRELPGAFLLRPRVTIAIESPDRRIDEVSLLLAEALGAGGVRASVSYRMARPGEITLEMPLTSAADSEAYDVIVTEEGVRLRGGGVRGLIWAVQTFRQLLPPEFEQRRRSGTWRIEAIEIHDAPRFRWRGAMLDAGRHFLSVAETNRFIDLMSRYKLNVLHWHLTEDQGWRLEIPRWPRLTEVGAWRTEPDGSRHGGFYTQREVQGVVDYARRRGITVVPEIEMPGHASAAVAAYPSLGCADTAIAVPNSWGVFPHVFCVERPAVHSFLDDVLDDVVALFPSRYIHLGGDEAPNIPDSVQVAFTRRMATALERRGRLLVGWDEITEGGLPPGVIVQVWRDMAHAESTARAGQDVIASPESHAYLNRSPADLPLETVYAFDPVPPALAGNAGRILGGEATLWSEHIDGANLDLMAFPRLLAFAEALWTTAPRDFAQFKQRLDRDQYARLRASGVTPGPERVHVARLLLRFDSATGLARMVPETGAPGVVVRHTRDGSPPTAASPPLDSMMTFDDGTIVARAFNGSRPTLIARTLTFERHLARRGPVALSAPPRPRYPGTGSGNATDGLLGSNDFDDGLWQGWLADFSVTIDLGAPRQVREVAGSFLQVTQSWILMPVAITVMYSDDRTTWQLAGTTTRPPRHERLEPHGDRIVVALPQPASARYVRIAVTTGGPLPAWHGGAGRPSWVFMDEVVVR